jgi:hypothetical protein
MDLFWQEIESMRREARIGLVWVAAMVVAGCAAPPPQVVYVPFPPSAEAAPAPTVAPTPVAARSQAELDEERTWRFCMRTASAVDRYVYGRDAGIDYTLARDWGLEAAAEHLQSQRREAHTAADHESLDRLARFTVMMTQQMVQQIYQRPYGNAAQERALWIESCIFDPPIVQETTG